MVRDDTEGDDGDDGADDDDGIIISCSCARATVYL